MINQFTEDELKMIRHVASTFQIVIEEAARIIQNLANSIAENWDELKEFIEEYIESSHPDRKPKWNPPKKLLLSSQVMNRKPMFIRARSNC